MINSIIYAAYSFVLVVPDTNINFIQNTVLFIITTITIQVNTLHNTCTSNKMVCYVAFNYCVKPLGFSFGLNVKVHVFQIKQYDYSLQT